MSVTDEHRISPSKILAKTKKAGEKEPDNDADDKKKPNSKGNAMLDFIAKHKKAAKN